MTGQDPGRQPPWVHVVTLTWNQRQRILRCLESLHGLTYPRLKLLVVDNGSSDGTPAAIADRYPEVHTLINATNLGFSGGFNVGLRHLLDQGAEYIFLVNNDTRAAPDLIDRLMSWIDLPHVGMVAPKIFRADDEARIWSVGGDCHPLTLEMTHTGDGMLDLGQWSRPIDRDYIVGCAFLVKRSLLDTVGLFDERFRPIYYEDSDLCLRARQAGFRLVLAPEAHLWHDGVGSAGGPDTPRHRYLMSRNSVFFFRKHVRGWRWLIVFPYRLGSAVKITIRLAIARRFASVAAHWRGLRDGFRQPGDPTRLPPL